LVNAGIKSPDDFNNIPFEDWKQTVSRTAVTKTTDIYGDETLTNGSSANIEAIFFEVPRNNDLWNRFGLVGGADGIIYVKTTQTLNKDDTITVNSKTYRCDKVTIRRPGGVAMYKVAPVFLVNE